MAGLAKNIRILARQATFLRNFSTRPCLAALQQKICLPQEIQQNSLLTCSKVQKLINGIEFEINLIIFNSY